MKYEKEIELAESNYNEVKEFMKELELKSINYSINQERERTKYINKYGKTILQLFSKTIKTKEERRNEFCFFIFVFK